MEQINFEPIITRQEITSRGGGMEISLDSLGYEGARMTAYQNYLGGGLLGRVCSDCSIRTWRNVPALVEISDQLKRYFHSITNPDSEWEGMDYDRNQNMPVSAY